jgi:DNA-binding winged helix-turn-helix (wHTH) protein
LDEPLLQFGPFSLQHDGTLFRHEEFIRLPPKELALLRVLIANPGQVVPLEILRKSAWNGIHVSDESLPRCISSLRAHLGVENCIQTVYKSGYRFRLPVNRVAAPMAVGTQGEKSSAIKGESPPVRTMRPAKLAILPLVALQELPQMLGKGIAEALMSRVARGTSSLVALIAWDSVFHLAQRGLVAREIGLAVGADVVLAGTVVALPTHLRVRAELIRVSDHVQLWLEDFLIPRKSKLSVDLAVEAQAFGEQAADRIVAGIAARMQATTWTETDSNKVLETSSSAHEPGRREASNHSRLEGARHDLR